MSDKELETFKKERNEAIRAGGELYRSFCKKWKIPMSNNPEVAERARLKAITGIVSIPQAERQAAKDELDKRGSSSWDDGDLL